MKAFSRSWSAVTILPVLGLTIIILVSTSVRAAAPSKVNAVAPVTAGSGSPESPTVGSEPSSSSLEWKYSVFGSSIGWGRISVFDIDGDDVLEMIMSGDSSTSSGGNDFWYVVKTTGGDAYDMVWSSDLYPAIISRIAVADVNADGIGEIYVGLVDGHVDRYDGLSMEQTGSFSTGRFISALVVADADGDGDQEIVISDVSGIYVYSALSLALEWSSPVYGGYDLAVGNVDADLAPEIVTTVHGQHGYVLDGISHVLEWDHINGFGIIVELGDVDSDGMAEIIAASNWGKITVFDADIQLPQWEITAFQGIYGLLVADTDGAGAPEILYGDDQWGAIHCYDSATQTERWYIDRTEYYATNFAVGDVNDDDVVEVLWGGERLHVADTLTHTIEWSSFDITGPLTSVDAGDVDDDGQTEIVMVSNATNGDRDDGAIHIFDAATHALEWRSTDIPGIVTGGVDSVKIGDVDADGQTEFVIATAHVYDGLIQIYDGQTHTLERQSPIYLGISVAALAIGDVDNDAKNEIVIGQGREHPSATGVYLIVFDGATIAEEWKIALDTYWGDVYDIELADVDNDSRLEILASVAGEEVYVYDGVTHQLDWVGTMQANALEVADVDGDINKEILVGKYDGVVDVYDGITHTLQNSFALGSGAILGLLIDDVDQDGSDEWVLSESTRLSVFRSAARPLVWRDSNLGSLLGNYNHLISLDIDDDLNKEFVFGSNYALWQFDLDLADHYVYLPLTKLEYCWLFDDFSDPESGWPISYDGHIRFEYAGGEYRIAIGPVNSWAAARPGVKHSDYTVEVDVRIPDHLIYGTYGLVFGLTDNWQKFYTFEIDLFGNYELWRYSNGWTRMTYGYSPYINQGSATNRLKIVRTGAQILAYANDNLLVNTTDAMSTGLTHTGLIATTYDQGDLDVRFDNFIMVPTGCIVPDLSTAQTTYQDNLGLPPPSSSETMSSGESDSKTSMPLELLP